MVIYRLLQGLLPDSYCLLSQTNYEASANQHNYSSKLPGRYYYLPPEFKITGDMPWWRRRTNFFLGILSGLLLRASQIARILKREKCEAVVGCTGGGDTLNLPLSYLASRLVGVPFYAFMFDYYSYQSHIIPLRFFAQRVEPLVLKGAAGIISPNELMSVELKERYNVESTVIHNSCDLSRYETVPDKLASELDGEIRIVFTGAVYQAHYDAFRNLIAAIKLLKRPNLKLHLYTAQSPASLAAEGIEGHIVFHEHQALSAMPAIQQQADILFLPLAFTSPYPILIKTSATTKLGEYLAARRPILVHAPPDSFLTWYFRQHDCGLVVDQSDPAQLAQAIEQALSNPDLQQRISVNAWARAQADFDLRTARAKFADLLKVKVQDRLQG